MAGRQLSYVQDIQSYTSDVTCVNVFGNQATVGIGIVKSSDPSFVGRASCSASSTVAHLVTRIAGFPMTSALPVVCPPLFFNVPVISGNYVIHDAAP